MNAFRLQKNGLLKTFPCTLIHTSVSWSKVIVHNCLHLKRLVENSVFRHPKLRCCHLWHNVSTGRLQRLNMLLNIFPEAYCFVWLRHSRFNHRFGRSSRKVLKEPICWAFVNITGVLCGFEIFQEGDDRYGSLSAQVLSFICTSIFFVMRLNFRATSSS